MSKKFKKIENQENNDLKFWFISSIKIDLWYMIAEENKSFYINQKQATELKSNIFYKKWVIKSI